MQSWSSLDSTAPRLSKLEATNQSNQLILQLQDSLQSLAPRLFAAHRISFVTFGTQRPQQTISQRNKHVPPSQVSAEGRLRPVCSMTLLRLRPILLISWVTAGGSTANHLGCGITDWVLIFAESHDASGALVMKQSGAQLQPPKSAAKL